MPIHPNQQPDFEAPALFDMPDQAVKAVPMTAEQRRAFALDIGRLAVPVTDYGETATDRMMDELGGGRAKGATSEPPRMNFPSERAMTAEGAADHAAAVQESGRPEQVADHAGKPYIV